MANCSLFTSALLRTRSFVFFAVHEPTEPFSALSSQRRQDVFLRSFWVSSFHNRTLLQATLALSLVISSLKLVCCDFSIFSAVMPQLPAPFNLIRNSTVHSPSSTIRDPSYGNVSNCSSCWFWMSMWNTTLWLANTFVLSPLMSRLYLQLTRSKRSTSSCSSASDVANRMMSSA